MSQEWVLQALPSVLVLYVAPGHVKAIVIGDAEVSEVMDAFTPHVGDDWTLYPPVIEAGREVYHVFKD